MASDDDWYDSTMNWAAVALVDDMINESGERIYFDQGISASQPVSASQPTTSLPDASPFSFQYSISSANPHTEPDDKRAIYSSPAEKSYVDPFVPAPPSLPCTSFNPPIPPNMFLVGASLSAPTKQMYHSYPGIPSSPERHTLMVPGSHLEASQSSGKRKSLQSSPAIEINEGGRVTEKLRKDQAPIPIPEGERRKALDYLIEFYTAAALAGPQPVPFGSDNGETATTRTIDKIPGTSVFSTEDGTEQPPENIPKQLEPSAAQRKKLMRYVKVCPDCRSKKTKCPPKHHKWDDLYFVAESQSERDAIAWIIRGGEKPKQTLPALASEPPLNLGVNFPVNGPSFSLGLYRATNHEDNLRRTLETYENTIHHVGLGGEARGETFHRHGLVGNGSLDENAIDFLSSPLPAGTRVLPSTMIPQLPSHSPFNVYSIDRPEDLLALGENDRPVGETPQFSCLGSLAPYSPTVCGRTFEDTAALQEHFKITHRHQPFNTLEDPLRLVCVACGDFHARLLPRCNGAACQGKLREKHHGTRSNHHDPECSPTSKITLGGPVLDLPGYGEYKGSSLAFNTPNWFGNMLQNSYDRYNPCESYGGNQFKVHEAPTCPLVGGKGNCRQRQNAVEIHLAIIRKNARLMRVSVSRVIACFSGSRSLLFGLLVASAFLLSFVGHKYGIWKQNLLPLTLGTCCGIFLAVFAAVLVFFMVSQRLPFISQTWAQSVVCAFGWKSDRYDSLPNAEAEALESQPLDVSSKNYCSPRDFAARLLSLPVKPHTTAEGNSYPRPRSESGKWSHGRPGDSGSQRGSWRGSQNGREKEQ